ncbi:hypothetical protein EDB89DRAFT_1912355 [Lactarius sanguifluus]|nr:hypothetical protein EDB89DRAFT_1912355 [Lactarius sanguifluus]
MATTNPRQGDHDSDGTPRGDGNGDEVPPTTRILTATTTPTATTTATVTTTTTTERDTTRIGSLKVEKEGWLPIQPANPREPAKPVTITRIVPLGRKRDSDADTSWYYCSTYTVLSGIFFTIFYESRKQNRGTLRAESGTEKPKLKLKPEMLSWEMSRDRDKTRNLPPHPYVPVPVCAGNPHPQPRVRVLAGTAQWQAERLVAITGTLAQMSKEGMVNEESSFIQSPSREGLTQDIKAKDY